MKISYELEQGYIDVWNEESEEWDRYIKVNKKSVVEERKIPEKIKTLKHSCNFDRHEEILYENQVDLANKITEILDYLKSKGE